MLTLRFTSAAAQGRLRLVADAREHMAAAFNFSALPFSPLVVSNRGPFELLPDGQVRRGSGGLVTAISTLVDRTKAPWIACASTEAERNMARMPFVDLSDGHRIVRVHYVDSDPGAYRKHYSIVANQALWPIQHRLPDIAPESKSLKDAWAHGYSVLNGLVGRRTAEIARRLPEVPVVLIQDYHLYLTARNIRRLAPGAVLQQFIHIPWPGPEDWSALPRELLIDLLDGLLTNDVIGFQTAADVDNFMACCEAAHVRIDGGRRQACRAGRVVRLRDYPISVDGVALEAMAKSAEVQRELRDLSQARPEKVILRVDRMDPAKNAIAGFRAYEQLLRAHPEWMRRVQFWAFLQPSRQDVAAYRAYAVSLKATVADINARLGEWDWTPIRLEVWENLPRALAAYQLFDVLLVNSRYDGMNLVAKEGMLLNRRSGALVLSKTTGAHKELGRWALSIAADDIDGTAVALNAALSLRLPERERRGRAIKAVIREHDLDRWIDMQLRDLRELVPEARLQSVG